MCHYAPRGGVSLSQYGMSQTHSVSSTHTHLAKALTQGSMTHGLPFMVAQRLGPHGPRILAVSLNHLGFGFGLGSKDTCFNADYTKHV